MLKEYLVMRLLEVLKANNKFKGFQSYPHHTKPVPSSTNWLLYVSSTYHRKREPFAPPLSTLKDSAQTTTLSSTNQSTEVSKSRSTLSSTGGWLLPRVHEPQPNRTGKATIPRFPHTFPHTARHRNQALEQNRR
jgi:hypothetical protein